MNPFLRKLALRAYLDDADAAALDAATRDVVRVEAGRDLVSEGERPEAAYVILDGFACRYKLVPDGGARSWPISFRATAATCTPPCSPGRSTPWRR
ncbi:hypothetical protein ACRBEV_20715 [Methylobacterium phyllosphaerae]